MTTRPTIGRDVITNSRNHPHRRGEQHRNRVRVTTHDAGTAGFLVWHLALRWRADVDRAVARLELTHAGYAILASLRALTRAGETPSQQRLAAYAGSGPASVSRTVRELERDGLVMRILDPSDQRTRRLSLTERGAAVADEANRIVQRLERQLMAPLGDPRGARATALATTLGTLLDGATVASQSPPATVTHAPSPVVAGRG